MQILGFIVWIKLAPRLEFGLFMCVLLNFMPLGYLFYHIGVKTIF